MIVSCLKGMCTFSAKVLETILLIVGEVLTISSLLLIALSISKLLYLTEYKQMWTAFMFLILLLGFICIGIALVELVLVHFSEKSELWRIATQRKAEKRLKLHLGFEGGLLCILGFACSFFANIYWGGDMRFFTGDPWWITAGILPFIIAVVTVFVKGVQGTIWSFISKNVTVVPDSME